MSVLEEKVEEIEQPEAKVEEKPAAEIAVKPEEKEDKPDKDYKELYENLRKGIKEERTEKSQLKREIEDMRSKFSSLETMKSEIEDYRRSKKEEAALKEYQENPAAFLLKRQDELSSKLEGLTKEQQEQHEAQARLQTFESLVRTQAQAYAKENPAYNDAVQFVMNRRFHEYDILGIDPEVREAYFHNESIQLSNQALQQGKNPAEVVYKLAETWGFKPQHVEAKKETSTEKVEKLEKGLQAAKTLSKGSSPEEESSFLKKIDDMDDDEFENFWEENVRGKKKR